jgi:hypothetical protein
LVPRPDVKGQQNPVTGGAASELIDTDPNDKRFPAPGTSASRFVAGKSKEVKNERKLNAKIFANPDGTKTAQVSGSPVHYTDDKGALQEIDNTIVPTAKGFKNAAGAETISFAAGSDSSEIVRIKKSNHEISFSMQGARPAKPEVEGTTITYPSVGDGIDLLYVLGSGTLKELVVLHNPPAPGAETTFRFDLNTGGLIPRETPSGGIDLVDSEGAIQFEIPPGVAMDSNPESAQAGFGPASLELVKQGKGWVVVLKGDAAWLAAPERQYPVYLDPSVAYGNYREFGSGYDAYVMPDRPDKNFGPLWVTYNPPGRWVNYMANIVVPTSTYARFELSQLSGPSGQSGEHVLSAYWLGHFEYDGYDNDNYRGHPTYALHKVPSSWNHNTITWNNQPPMGTPTKIGDGTPTGWNIVDVKDWVQGWTANPSTNHGILFDSGIAAIAQQASTHSFKFLASDENSDGYAPFLWIDYSNQPPAVSNVVSPVAGSVINTLTPP